ncbi:MAG: hypothetical protein ACSLEX_03510 [Minisyncoccota bacterium]
MFERSLLILILILQAIFSGLVFAGNESSFNWESLFSFLQIAVVVLGFFWGYYLLKKEISFKKKLEIHAKLTNMLVKGLHESFYWLAPFLMNRFFLEKSNLKDGNDYSTKSLRDNSKELGKKISDFQSDFLRFYEFFQLWKVIFSEKLDRESKFLLDLENIFCEELRTYQGKLMDYSMLSLMKDEATIEKERKELLDLEEKISRKRTALANGLDKFVSDMSREVFSGLFDRKKSVERGLFDPELENANNGDSAVILTDKGFVRQSYQKTAFQKEFGGFKERQRTLREFLEKN